MTELKEFQFELLDSEETPDDGFAFGIDLEISVNEDGFEPGTQDWTTQDTENTSRGFTQFGVDNLQGPTWSWAGHANRKDTAGALESIGRGRTAWRARNIVREEGAVTALRYRIGGRDRRIYGRPRNFTYTPNNLILGGYIPVTKDFKCVDSYHYDDDVSAVTVYPHLAPAPNMTFPLTFPLAASPASGTDEPIYVDGDAETYPVITFRGPVTNPFLTTRDWTITLSTTIFDGDYVTVDLRPWHLSILKNDTYSIAGVLGRRQWLEDMMLEPGENTLVFGGAGDTSGALCDVRWRSAWNSL